MQGFEGESRRSIDAGLSEGCAKIEYRSSEEGLLTHKERKGLLVYNTSLIEFYEDMALALKDVDRLKDRIASRPQGSVVMDEVAEDLKPSENLLSLNIDLEGKDFPWSSL